MKGISEVWIFWAVSRLEFLIPITERVELGEGPRGWLSGYEATQQRILGHASATMTMDLYGHLIDQNLWDSAKRLGGILGASEGDAEGPASADGGEEGA